MRSQKPIRQSDRAAWASLSLPAVLILAVAQTACAEGAARRLQCG